MTLLLVYAGVCLLLYSFQRSLLYFPQARTDIAGTVLIQLQSDGAILNVSSMQPMHATAVIYFGGNAEDVSLSLPELALAFPNSAIYAMHYRSYGGSSGTPTESSLVKDGLVLFDQLKPEHTAITVIGRSLGSGIAVQLASERSFERLVLITPYDSVQNIAVKQFPLVPVGLLLQDKYESWRFAGKLTVPTLIIAAAHDEVIPLENTRALLDSFPAGVAQWVVLPGTGHNTVSHHPEYLKLLGASPGPHDIPAR